MKYLLILLILLCFGCKETEPKPSASVRPPENFVRTYVFYEGSYWVYRDSASGLEDSVSVSALNSSLKMGGDQTNDSYLQQVLVMDMQSSQRGRLIFGAATGYPNSSTLDAPYILYTTSGIGGTLTLAFEAHWGNPGNVGLWRNYNDSINFLDSSMYFNIGQMQIGPCYHFMPDASLINTGNFLETWFFKSVGLVRYKTKDGRVWVLDRWKTRSPWPLDFVTRG